MPLELIHRRKNALGRPGRGAVVEVHQVSHHGKLASKSFPVRFGDLFWFGFFRNAVLDDVGRFSLRHEVGDRGGRASSDLFLRQIKACFFDELLHFRRQFLPAPETPGDELLRKAALLRPSCEELFPAVRHLRVGDAKRFKLGFEHRRAEITADPFISAFVERVVGKFPEPQIEEHIKSPPGPDRGEVQLQGIGRVLTQCFKRSPAPGLIPAVSLDRQTLSGICEMDFERIEFEQFAAPAVILSRRSGFFHCLPEVAGFLNDLDAF